MGRVVVHVCIMLQALLWNMFSFLERHPLAGGGLYIFVTVCMKPGTKARMPCILASVVSFLLVGRPGGACCLQAQLLFCGCEVMEAMAGLPVNIGLVFLFLSWPAAGGI